MIFNLAATFISAALLVPNVVFGQAPTNTSQIPACVLNCTLVSLPAGNCTGVTDLSCICTSTAFQTAAGTCIATDCPTETTAATQIQNATCGPYLAGLSSSSSASGSVSGSHTSTRAPSTTGGASTTHPTTTTTSSSAGFHTAGIASGVALALFGAAFSLF